MQSMISHITFCPFTLCNFRKLETLPAERTFTFPTMMNPQGGHFVFDLVMGTLSLPCEKQLGFSSTN